MNPKSNRIFIGCRKTAAAIGCSQQTKTTPDMKAARPPTLFSGDCSLNLGMSAKSGVTPIHRNTIGDQSNMDFFS
jgi:hypothetical protein